MNLPKYKDLEIIENRENKSSEVAFIRGAGNDALEFYSAHFASMGYEKKEERRCDDRVYLSYRNGENGVFINYFGNIGELYIVVDENTEYFMQGDDTRECSEVPQITQVKLEDYGMSYAIRLCDGRYIVIDGGREFMPEAERLYACLKDGTKAGKPRIAAWVMTHPHSDHFHAFIPFFDNFGDLVEIESFILNFPERDDVAHYPKLTAKDWRFEDDSAFTNIKLMFDRIEKTDATIYSAHTGQTYRFGGAELCVLASMDDTIHVSGNINATSLVIRMTLAGQVILWASDAPFSDVRLSEKYGAYLKSDILQIPHHGFQGGSAEGEISGYKLIRPTVAFLPVSDFNAYTAFCVHKEGTRYIMENAGLSEIITGEVQRTIDLPYTPEPYRARELSEKMNRGLRDCGARTFVYCGLNTANEEDLIFTFLNSATARATVDIELFFENSKQNIRYIKLMLPPFAYKTVSIVGDEVDGDALYFNWMSLKDLGVPSGANFAVRFISNVPLVISNKNHAPSYTA